jgi:hypothetical protein
MYVLFPTKIGDIVQGSKEVNIDGEDAI